MLRTVTKHSTIIITCYHRYREIIQITKGPPLRQYRKKEARFEDVKEKTEML